MPCVVACCAEAQQLYFIGVHGFRLFRLLPSHVIPPKNRCNGANIYGDVFEVLMYTFARAHSVCSDLSALGNRGIFYLCIIAMAAKKRNLCRRIRGGVEGFGVVSMDLGQLILSVLASPFLIGPLLGSAL